MLPRLGRRHRSGAASAGTRAGGGGRAAGGCKKPPRSHRDPAGEGVCKNPALHWDHDLCLQVKEMVLKISPPRNKIHFIRIRRQGSTLIHSFFPFSSAA